MCVRVCARVSLSLALQIFDVLPQECVCACMRACMFACLCLRVRQVSRQIGVRRRGEEAGIDSDGGKGADAWMVIYDPSLQRCRQHKT